MHSLLNADNWPSFIVLREWSFKTAGTDSQAKNHADAMEVSVSSAGLLPYASPSTPALSSSATVAQVVTSVTTSTNTMSATARDVTPAPASVSLGAPADNEIAAAAMNSTALADVTGPATTSTAVEVNTEQQPLLRLVSTND